MSVCENHEKKCATCKWRSDGFTSACVNDRSDRLADFVMPDEVCDEWEEADEDH